LDFVHDVLGTGHRVRVLSVPDTYTRECLAPEVDTSFASRRVTRVLERVTADRGRPESLRRVLAWCVERKIQLVYIEPGRPMQNGRAESFQGKFRDECLNVSWFRNLWEAREKVEGWRREYNQTPPIQAWDIRRQRRSRRARRRPRLPPRWRESSRQRNLVP
jgi:putative transposase